MEQQKQCFKCGEIKEINEFYRHPRMADGHLNKCKECQKADMAARRTEAIEYYRAYDRERAKTPERRAAADEHQKKWRQQNRNKQRAQRKVAYYVSTGQLTAQPCAVCGSREHIHGHHDDYTKPLDITWLCPVHHFERHAEMKEAGKAP